MYFLFFCTPGSILGLKVHGLKEKKKIKSRCAMAGGLDRRAVLCIRKRFFCRNIAR